VPVIAVNDVKPVDLIQEYNNYYSSDGYNTLKPQIWQNAFPYFTVENGIKDSLTYT
jgi:hypothetical protein